MSVYEITDKKSIEPLFEDWQETMIWSCLQNYMGKAYGVHMESPKSPKFPKPPKSAKIIIADFCFLAGEENEELVKHWSEEITSNFLIMIPEHEGWSQMIEQVWKGEATRRTRYAIKKEKDIFDREKLIEIAASIEEPFALKLIDEELYHQIMGESWCRDLCGQFHTYEDYKTRGIGVAAVKDGIVVSGASSYTVYRDGIEIEIDTKEEYRRKGLALACGAGLILECLDRGLYPSWDAQNPGSVALAKKLGYHFDYEYPVYEIEREAADKTEQFLTGK